MIHQPFRQAAIAAVLTLSPAVLASDLSTSIDHIAAQALHDGPVAGLSIAVARHGQLVFGRGYGLADREKNVAASVGTVYSLASITKNLTAAAVMQLVGQGKLRLDDEVSRYLPKVNFEGRRVLVRQLLNHTSGIRSDAALAPWAMLLAPMDLAFDFAPGESWGYSNSGFQLLGLIIERVSGQSYLSYIRDHVLRPLGMTGTAYCSEVRERAAGYRIDEAGDFQRTIPLTMALSYAAGGFCSTVIDMVRWQAALNDGRVVTPWARDAMRTPTPFEGGVAVDYGFGTRIGSLDGHRFVGHSGSGGGFSTALAYFPDSDLTVVVLINTAARPGARVIASRVARAALALPQVPVRELPVPPGTALQLSGLWETTFGTAVLFEDRGKLWFRAVDSPGKGLRLKYIGQGTFELNPDQVIRFVGGARARPRVGLTYEAGFFDGAFWRTSDLALGSGTHEDAGDAALPVR